jgi:hypothetical protein
VPSSLLSALRIYTDPLQHAAIASAVVAPLVPRAGRGVVGTAVTAGLVIDVDHAVAARSVAVSALTALDTRPRTHSAVTAAAVGAVVAAAAGPVHGWAAFAGLASHLAHDAGDRAAATPLLWPFAPARQIGRRRQLAVTAVLVAGSVVVSRVAAGASPSGTPAAGGAGAADRRRTA